MLFGTPLDYGAIPEEAKKECPVLHSDPWKEYVNDNFSGHSRLIAQGGKPWHYD